MIKLLQIKNIQSHIDSKLKFHPGVNMIIGPSNNGKSAILNSLFWCMYNRPLGDSYRNWNGGEMSVKTILDNGIVQISKDKQTKYKIIQNKKITKFKAFGTDPPQEVTNLFNMDRKINFQKQLEKKAPIFLLSESPGEVAAFFNKVSGLYKIDETITKGKSDLRKTYSDLNNTKEQIKNKQQEIDKYKGIDDLYSDICFAHQIAQEQAKNDQKISIIENIVNDINLIQQKNKILKQKLKIKDDLKEAIKTQKEQKEQINKKLLIQSDIKEINLIESFIMKEKNKMLIKPKINEALNFISKVKQKTEQAKQIYNTQQKINNLNKAKQNLINKQKEQQKEFNKLMPKQCPLCGK